MDEDRKAMAADGPAGANFDLFRVSNLECRAYYLLMKMLY
jgi:hypothetical protein